MVENIIRNTDDPIIKSMLQLLDTIQTASNEIANKKKSKSEQLVEKANKSKNKQSKNIDAILYSEEKYTDFDFEKNKARHAQRIKQLEKIDQETRESLRKAK